MTTVKLAIFALTLLGSYGAQAATISCTSSLDKVSINTVPVLGASDLFVEHEFEFDTGENLASALKLKDSEVVISVRAPLNKCVNSDIFAYCNSGAMDVAFLTNFGQRIVRAQQVYLYTEEITETKLKVSSVLGVSTQLVRKKFHTVDVIMDFPTSATDTTAHRVRQQFRFNVDAGESCK